MLWLVSPAAPMWRTLQNSDMWQLLQWIVVFHCLFFVLIFICARSSSFYTWALGIVSIQASRLARLVFQEPFICFQRALLQTKNINNHGFLGTSSALFVSFLSSLIFLWGPPPPSSSLRKRGLSGLSWCTVEANKTKRSSYHQKKKNDREYNLRFGKMLHFCWDCKNPYL